MKRSKHRLSACLTLVGLIACTARIAGAEGLLTFDAVPAGPLPRGGTYVEAGMQATSFSDFSQLGDPLGTNPTGNALYFHGNDQYVEFQMVDGSVFDLASFDALTNGFTDSRWVEASSGAMQTFPGLSSQTVILGPGFQNITWFRIGTPSFATEVDNVRFRPYGAYTLVPDRGGDSGQTTVQMSGSGFSTATSVTLQRAGEPDILGTNTAVDLSADTVTTTFDLTGAAPGQWDVVIETGGEPFILAYAFTVEGTFRLTFDTIPAGPLPRGGTYTEAGMQATSFSDFSQLGDPLGTNPTGNALYFHGADQYIEFQMVDGSVFDLASFDVLTNGFTDSRWVEASSGATQTFPGLPSQTVILGPGFQNITWFRIGTPSFATEVDNVRFRPYGPYALVPDRGGDSGQTTVQLSGSGFSTATGVTLQRAGEPDILGTDTTVDPGSDAVTSTFDLTGAAPGQWDVVIETAGEPFILAYAFTVEGTFRLTFDTIPAGPLPRGGTYTEAGMQATSFSDFSELGDPLGTNLTGNALYFHGADQYIEFQMVDGSEFSLIGFDALTNGFTDGRWVTASSGVTQTFPGEPWQQVVLGPGFQNITWFRIGTPSFATEVDNVRFAPAGAFWVWPSRGGDTGRVTVTVGGTTLSAASVVTLKRGGDTIEGNLTGVGEGGIVLQTTFDLAAVAQGAWDVVLTNEDGTTLTLPGGFTVEAERAAQLWVDIVGRTTIRGGRAQRYSIIYGNRGNVDARGALLMITGMPADSSIRTSFGFRVEPAAGLLDATNRPPEVFTVDGARGIFSQIGRVPASFAGQMVLELTTGSESPFSLEVRLAQ